MDGQLYGYTLDEHEYRADVPQIMSDDGPVTFYLSAHGGGTVGEAYGQNGWDYLVTVDGRPFIEGGDLRSGAPATHAEMARALAGFLGAAGGSFWYHEHVTRDGWQASEHAGGYTQEQAEWLAANNERLSCMDLDPED